MPTHMVEFISKFQGHRIKISRFHSILVAKPQIFFNILRAISPQVTSLLTIVFFEMRLSAYLT